MNDNENELMSDMSDFDESLLNYQKTTSLNQATNEDGGEIIDLIIGDDDDKNSETLEISDIVKTELKNILSDLDERERMIIECYFGINTEHDGMTLEAIGDKYDLTKERIRQIKEKAIRKLRHNTKKLQSLMNL